MAFDPRHVAIASLVLAAGCAGERGRFPLREPMMRDTDLDPVSLPCRQEPTPKEPNKIVCAPAEYISPLVWDGVDNSLFRPFSDALAIKVTHEAVNADAFDEVADSAWFTNRLGLASPSLEELIRGACKPEQMLDTTNIPPGSWIIDKGKDNGSSPGFRVKVPGKGKYMLKSDGDIGERPSAAAVIGAAAYHAAGFNFSCEQVVYVNRAAFTLTPGLTVTDNADRTRPFDEKALDKLLTHTGKRGDLLRFQASAWLSGRLIGPFKYEGTREDDPNDVIPHENRRELRGARLLAAWLDHFDAREQNSMDIWVANDAAHPDSSPGYVRHYYLDTSDTLGSEWDWDGVSRRLGQSYLLDFADIGTDFITFGLLSRPWDRARREPGREIFGYYSARDFDPATWVNEYPNPAFSRMTERDGAWMARILAGFTPELVHALAGMGRFTDPGNTEYLAGVVEARLELLLRRYLMRLSPLARVHVEGDRLCATDLADLRGLRPSSDFHYRATEHGRPLAVDTPAPAKVCALLAHGGEPYRTITLEDGVARGSLVAHLYDLGMGADGGYRLAGLERPEP
jgi:hypothetical protein